VSVRQWIKKAQLLIGTDNEVLDVSQLHFKFDIQDSNISTPSVMQLRLWNPAPSTVKNILENGNNCSLSAGYEGNFGQIFKGSIIQQRSGHEDGTNSYLDLSVQTLPVRPTDALLQSLTD
jgi:hypothetical protein